MQVNHEFITYNLVLQGMAPASSGYAAGLTSQMVGGAPGWRPVCLPRCCCCAPAPAALPTCQACNRTTRLCVMAPRTCGPVPEQTNCDASSSFGPAAGAFWPSTTGEPHHRMSFYNSTIRLVSATCGANSTAFSVSALHQASWGGRPAPYCEDRDLLLCPTCRACWLAPPQPALRLLAASPPCVLGSDSSPWHVLCLPSTFHPGLKCPLHACKCWAAAMRRPLARPSLRETAAVARCLPLTSCPPPCLQVLGRSDTVTQLDNRTFFVGQRINGSYAVRILPTGDAGRCEQLFICCLRMLHSGALLPTRCNGRAAGR